MRFVSWRSVLPTSGMVVFEVLNYPTLHRHHQIVCLTRILYHYCRVIFEWKPQSCCYIFSYPTVCEHFNNNNTSENKENTVEEKKYVCCVLSLDLNSESPRFFKRSWRAYTNLLRTYVYRVIFRVHLKKKLTASHNILWIQYSNFYGVGDGDGDGIGIMQLNDKFNWY